LVSPVVAIPIEQLTPNKPERRGGCKVPVPPAMFSGLHLLSQALS
jgi:hypothetical protein